MRIKRIRRTTSYVLRFTLITSLFSLPFKSFAQFDMQIGVSPDRYQTKISTEVSLAKIEPFAQALAQDLLTSKTTTYWATVGLSSSTTQRDLNQYIRKGYGRVELIALMLMAENSNKNISELAKQREEGKKLKELAAQFQLDYQKIRKEAIMIRDRCLKILNSKLENPKHEHGINASTVPRTE